VADEIGGAGFDQLFEQAKQALDAVRGGQRAAAADDDAEPVVGAGEAADGQVTASVSAGGKVERITVNPRLLRDGIDVVCEHIAAAVNAALDDLRRRSAAAQPVGAPDPAALAGQLRELQDESMRKMSAFGAALTDALAKVRDSGR
jgi:DNA-binding protein YbaB